MGRSDIVSIIIPSYNTADYIIKTLISIQEQEYLNFECLIIDDYSTDDTYDLASQFCQGDSRFKIIRRLKEYDKGANSCRITGYKSISNQSEYILFFDSDDIMKPDNIKAKMAILKNNIKINCCFSWVGTFNGDYDSDNDYLNTVYYKSFFSKDIFWDFATQEIVFYYINGLFHRHYLDKLFADFGIEYFIDPELPCYQDYYLFLMLIDKGFTFELIEKPLVLYRDRANSISRNLQTFDSEKFDIGLNTLLKIRNRLSTLGRANRVFDLFITRRIISASRFCFLNYEFKNAMFFYIKGCNFNFNSSRGNSLLFAPLYFIYICTGRLNLICFG